MVYPPLLRPALLLVLVSASAAGQGVVQTPEENLRFSFPPTIPAYTITSRDTEVSFTFEVQSVKGEIKGVRLEATPFFDSAGRSHDARLTVAVDGKTVETFNVGATQSVLATLTASLPRPGTYTSQLTLIYGGERRAPVALAVNRPMPELDIPDIPPVRAENGTALVPLSVLEKTGQKVEIEPPQLIKLVVDSEEEVKFDARSQWKVRDCQKPAEESASAEASPEAASSLAEGTPAAPAGIDSATPTHESSTDLCLEITGLDDPGHYEGTVRFALGDAPAVSKSFSVYTRRSMWLALLWIAVGIGLSMLLRWFLTQVRPRLVEERRAGVLLRELEENARPESYVPPRLDERELTLIQELRRQLTELANRLSQGTPSSEVSPKLDLLQGKIPLVREWIRLRRAVREIDPPTLRKGFEDKLIDTEKQLLDPAHPASPVQAALQAMPGDIEKAIRESLDLRLEELADELSSRLQSASDSLRTALQYKVQPALRRAREAREADRLEDAARALEEAQLAFAVASANDLAARLQGPAPEGLTDEWQALTARVLTRLAPALQPSPDLDEAAEAVKGAQKLYFEDLADALLHRIDQSTAGLADSDPKKDRLLAIQTNLRNAQAAISAGKLDEAGPAILKAQEDYAKTIQNAAGAKMGKSDTVQAVRAVAPSTERGLFGSLRFLLPGSSTVTQGAMLAADRTLRLADWLATAIILLVAALLGVNALWITDLAWGGFGDQLTAFLWGLGLHQFTFSGVKDLLARFT